MALHRAGYAVLTAPFSDNLRYDCVVDTGTQLLRVQIKTGRTRDGCVRFNTASVAWWRRTRRDYRGEVDVFVVWCPDTGGVYVVPVEHCGQCDARLRLTPPRNGQRAGVRWAADYALREAKGVD